MAGAEHAGEPFRNCGSSKFERNAVGKPPYSKLCFLRNPDSIRTRPLETESVRKCGVCGAFCRCTFNRECPAMNWKKSIDSVARGCHRHVWSAQDQKALTNKDVMDMVKKGLSESVIVKVIQASDTNFDTSPDAMTQTAKRRSHSKSYGRHVQGGAGKKKAEATAPPAAATPAPQCRAGRCKCREISSQRRN